MAVKASASITLSFMVDIKAVYRYYLLQSSTTAEPSVPTTNPPNGWSDSEPSYTSGDTSTLYFVDLTVFTNDTYVYSKVSKSSAYEAAKEAYNKALAAGDAVDVLIVDTQTALEGVTNANDKITEAVALIEALEGSISMLVTDENGASLMTQTDEGWTFNMGTSLATVNTLSQNLNDLANTLGNTNAVVSNLQTAIQDLETTTEHILITTYEDQPCISLAESDSDFRLLITNTRIMFMNGATLLTYIDTTGLVTENIEVKKQFKQDYFLTTVRENGNRGTRWIGGENLLGSPFFNQASYGPFSNNYAFLTIYQALEVGVTYTLSVESTVVTSGSATKFSVVCYNLSSDTSGERHDIPISTTRQSVTFYATQPDLLMYAGVVSATSGIGLRWTKLKLEKGSVATPWCLPKDVIG